MMTLRKMTEDEFRAFKKFSVADYASDLMKGRDMNPEQALMEAEMEFGADLPRRAGYRIQLHNEHRGREQKESRMDLFQILFARRRRSILCVPRRPADIRVGKKKGFCVCGNL